MPPVSLIIASRVETVESLAPKGALAVIYPELWVDFFDISTTTLIQLSLCIRIPLRLCISFTLLVEQVW
jgi:hypothetical protein